MWIHSPVDNGEAVVPDRQKVEHFSVGMGAGPLDWKPTRESRMKRLEFRSVMVCFASEEARFFCNFYSRFESSSYQSMFILQEQQKNG